MIETLEEACRILNERKWRGKVWSRPVNLSSVLGEGGSENIWYSGDDAIALARGLQAIDRVGHRCAANVARRALAGEGERMTPKELLNGEVYKLCWLWFVRGQQAEREACAEIADAWANSQSCDPSEACKCKRTAFAISERIRQRAEPSRKE